MIYSISPAVAQVLRGMALNRTPGWNFPGHFLALSFDEVAPHRAELSLDQGPHCEGERGGLALAAACVLADVAMAAALRHEAGFTRRMATVHMSLSFPGLPLRGRVYASSTAQGQSAGTHAAQLFTQVALRAQDGIGCIGTGSFLALGTEGLARMPMHRRTDGPVPAPPLRAADLGAEERRVLQRAQEADDGRPGFLHRFWGLLPERADGSGAECALPAGLHVGNRVGHVQGGILLALAAQTCQAAAGPGWALSQVSGWYLAAGLGDLRAIATPLHSGSRTACMRCETRDGNGRLLMHAVATLARCASP